MPIPEQELEQNYIAVDGQMTVRELGELVRLRSTRPTYLIVTLQQGAYSATLLSQVERAVTRLGPSALGLPLAQLPAVAEPTGAVQRMEMGFGMAERERDRQPRRRLVVLEGDHPLGLLVNESRGGDVGGLPFDLFGRYQDGIGDEMLQELESHTPSRRCPVCSQSFVFYELQPDLGAYACPHCHSVLDAE